MKRTLFGNVVAHSSQTKALSPNNIQNLITAKRLNISFGKNGFWFASSNIIGFNSPPFRILLLYIWIWIWMVWILFLVYKPLYTAALICCYSQLFLTNSSSHILFNSTLPFWISRVFHLRPGLLAWFSLHSASSAGFSSCVPGSNILARLLYLFIWGIATIQHENLLVKILHYANKWDLCQA